LCTHPDYAGKTSGAEARIRDEMRHTRIWIQNVFNLVKNVFSYSNIRPVFLHQQTGHGSGKPYGGTLKPTPKTAHRFTCHVQWLIREKIGPPNTAIYSPVFPT